MVKGVHGRLSFEVRTITILDSPMKSTIDASSWSPAQPATVNRALFKKIALRILPLIFVAYVFAFLDRVNIG